MPTLKYDFGNYEISYDQLKCAIAYIVAEKMKEPKNRLPQDTMLMFLDCLDEITLDNIFIDFQEDVEEWFYDEALESYKLGEYLDREKQNYANRI